MMKRLFDLIVSFTALILVSPILAISLLAVFLQDFKNPFYIAPRVGRNEKIFKMFKIRSMVVNADITGVDSTSSNDMRITQVGHLIRKFKIDEISQLINVFLGDMSLVGPRPNVKRETDIYTKEEKVLLTVRPGITDISSIVFSDEGEILKDSNDPDLLYNQIIRPWKSRLGIFYIENRSLFLDIRLIIFTVLAITNKALALERIVTLLEGMNADSDLVKISSRKGALTPAPPPGASEIVSKR